MKRTVCRIFYLCLSGLLLSGCIPLPTIRPAPNIIALNRDLKQVASGDAVAQTPLAIGFFSEISSPSYPLINSIYPGTPKWGGGLGKDDQTRWRLLYAAADHGDINAYKLLIIFNDKLDGNPSMSSHQLWYDDSLRLLDDFIKINYKLVTGNKNTMCCFKEGNMMEQAYWSYQLAQGDDRNAMALLANLYDRPGFPAYNPVESCKWRLRSKYGIDQRDTSFEHETCDPQK